MKKFILLSGVALFTAISNAQAGYWNWSNNNSIVPYIGGEYVYSRAKNGGYANDFKKNFHSGKADLGLEWNKNIYTEFSFQMSGELKNRDGYLDRTVKNSFSAYAMDLYGKFPIMCSNLGALLTGGAAIYHVNYKDMPNKSFNRVGYRAGLGMQYDLSKHWAARVVGRYSYVGADRINNYKEVTVGMLYRF